MTRVATKPDLWLVGRRFDTFYFQLSGLLCLSLLIPYVVWGSTVVLPIYNLYLVVFGLPHNYLTWASILPGGVRSSINLRAVILPAVVCLAITSALPFVHGSPVRDWILTLITIASLWHAYRQHHGLCKIYDAVQSRRTGDPSIFADRKPLNLFFGLAAWGIVVWAFSHEQIRYLLSADDFYHLVYPRIPQPLFRAYVVVTALVGIWGCKRAVWDRWRRGRFVPWPQILLIGVALATYIVPYLVVPIEAMPLAVAIATIYHNVQYFAFVWLFERYRSRDLSEAGSELALPQRIVLRGSWQMCAAIALSYSLVIVSIYLAAPQSFGLVLIYYIAFAHYVIDGIIWRRQNNRYLGVMIGGLSGAQDSRLPLTNNLAPRETAPLVAHA